MMLNRLLSLALGVALLALFGGYLITDTVNFDETAVVTTFGKAAAEDVRNAEGDEAGMFLRFPWPIQRIIRFDRRVQVIEDRLEQQETKDKQVVIAKAYLLWRIADPLAFYRLFGSNDRAASFLRERLRAAKAEIGAFSFEDLTSIEPKNVRLAEAGDAIRDRIRRDLQAQGAGVEIMDAGINRILLPENITRSVFSRMRQTRQRLAQNARSEGTALARSITAKTDSDQKRITAFAERMAQHIRAEGDAAAARYYREYSKNPEFAVFLRKLDALERSMEKNATFILDTESEPFDLLK
jgi:membrane protease subunit HflC